MILWPGCVRVVDTFRRAPRGSVIVTQSRGGRLMVSYHGADLGSLHPASTWCPCLGQSEARADDHWPMGGQEPASHPSLGSWPASALPQPLSYLQREASEVSTPPEAGLWLVSSPWCWPLIGPSCDVSPRPWWLATPGLLASHTHPGSLDPSTGRHISQHESQHQPHCQPPWVRSILQSYIRYLYI